MKYFITLEGGEGAGKSTLISFLKNFFTEKGWSVVTTREPGGSLLGEEIRKLLLTSRENEEMTPMAELLLFLAARAQHLESKIKPALASGKIVLCDRFTDSTLAYQSAARGLDLTTVQKLCALTTGQFHPSLTFYLDVPPEVGIQRAMHRSKRQNTSLDRMENEALSFHERVRQGFLAIAKEEPQRVQVIDTTQSKIAVEKQAKKVIETWLCQH